MSTSSRIFDDRDQEISYNADHWALKNNDQESGGTDHFCNIVGGTATFKFDGKWAFLTQETIFGLTFV